MSDRWQDIHYAPERRQVWLWAEDFAEPVIGHYHPEAKRWVTCAGNVIRVVTPSHFHAIDPPAPVDHQGETI